VAEKKSEKKATTKKTTTKSSTKKPSTTKKKKATTTRVKKTSKQVKEEIVTKEAVETVFEGNKGQRKRLGKTFYLFFSIFLFVGSYFYINNVLYDNEDHIQSATFAFAVLFIVLVLLNFNVHMMVINFFRLPFKFLIEEARLEVHKDLIVEGEKGIKRKFSQYKAVFNIVLYVLILILLMGSQVYNGIMDDDKVLVIVTQSLSTGFVFLVIICSWQYLFNIIPSILENSIDAKNGFVLTLSAFVLVIYIVFIIFDISYLAETMIFVLIAGFIALLGVNLNMIIGEFNIFKNIRNRRKQSKAVTRAVFMIFFSFHLYIILYASVVAYSIYNQNPDAYNFNNTDYKEVIVEDVSRYTDNPVISEVYDEFGDIIDVVYDSEGNEITDFYLDGHYVKEYYNESGDLIEDFYIATDLLNPITEVTKDGVYYYSYGSHQDDPYFVYYEGTLVGIDLEEIPHTYGDMLYYAIITISSIGYGDITPNTNYSLPQFWGAFLSIYGITFYALSIGYVSNIASLGLTDEEEGKQV
jgi:hypothetical protein